MPRCLPYPHGSAPLRAALLLAVLALCAAWPAVAPAQQPIGQLMVEKGRVKITRASGASRVVSELGVEVPVFEGDALHSAQESRARLQFAGSQEQIQIYSATFLRVDALRPGRASFALSIGKALFNVFARARASTLQVRTPTATIGIKGTEFVVGVDEERTLLLTLSGVVSMISLALPDREVLIDAGRASRAQRGEPPTPPVAVPPDKQERILQEDSQEGLEGAAPPEGGIGGSDAAAQAATATDQVRSSTETVRSAGFGPPASSGGRIRFGIGVTP